MQSPLISQVTVTSTAQSLTEPSPQPAAVVESEGITSPPGKEQLGKMLVPGKLPSPPVAGKTFLSQLLHAILRLGNALRSLAGIIAGLFTSSQRASKPAPAKISLPEPRPVTEDEAIAAVLAQQKNGLNAARNYATTDQDSSQEVLAAQVNKYVNESALPVLRSIKVGGAPPGHGIERWTTTNSYFEHNTAGFAAELPELPIERYRSNFSGVVAFNHNPLARLALELTSAKSDDPSKRIDPARQSYRDALEKYLVLVELDIDIAAVIAEIEAVEIAKSALIAADDTHLVSEDTQQVTVTSEAIEAQTQQPITKKVFQSFDATVARLTEAQQLLEIRKKTLAQHIEQLAVIVFGDSTTTDSSSVSFDDTDRAAASQLVRSAKPTQGAIPKRGILKRADANTDKASKKAVSFDPLVETRSKPKWSIDPDHGQLEKASETSSHIELFQTLPSRPKGAEKTRLTPEQRLILFLQDNGLITSDSFRSTEGVDETEGVSQTVEMVEAVNMVERLDWDALTNTAARLKQEEQESSRQTRQFNASLPKSEKSSLARPQNNHQFIYWKPEKMTLQEWALIGHMWPLLNHPRDYVGHRAAQLKFDKPHLFKGWNTDVSYFTDWYGPVTT